MAYVKTTWASGDVVTSAKLNNMENGIYNANVGFDCIIKTDTDTWEDATLTLFHGDFATACAKLEAGNPMIACVVETDSESSFCGQPIYLEATVISGDNPSISLSNIDILGSAGVISWTADGVEYVAN